MISTRSAAQATRTAKEREMMEKAQEEQEAWNKMIERQKAWEAKLLAPDTNFVEPQNPDMTTFDVNEFLRKYRVEEQFEKLNFHQTYLKKFPRIQLNNGVQLSIQVSHTHYCTPRDSMSSYYSCVEVGCMKTATLEDRKYFNKTFSRFADGDIDDNVWVFGYVPVDKLETYINGIGVYKILDEEK